LSGPLIPSESLSKVSQTVSKHLVQRDDWRLPVDRIIVRHSECWKDERFGVGEPNAQDYWYASGHGQRA